MGPNAIHATAVPISVAPPTSTSASAPAGRPEGHAHGDLALTHHRACKHQGRHVRAGDDQQEDEEDSHTGQEERHRAVHRAVGEPVDSGAEPLVHLGKVGGGAAAHHIQLSPSAVQSRAGCQPCEHCRTRSGLGPDIARLAAEWHPGVLDLREGVPLRHDADDCGGGSSQLDGPADCVTVAGQERLPRAVAQHHNTCCSRALVGVGQKPPHCRRNPGQPECGRADPREAHRARFPAVAHETLLHGRVATEVLKRRDRFPPDLEVVQRCQNPPSGLGIDLVEANNPVAVLTVWRLLEVTQLSSFTHVGRYSSGVEAQIDYPRW
jgi:hypothetical protein